MSPPPPTHTHIHTHTSSDLLGPALSQTEKLLGVYIDSNLSWSQQVEATIKKCNSLLYLLNRIKCYLSIPIRKLFFNAYILPHIDYCCTVWGNLNTTLTNTVVNFLKRAERIILDKDMETPSLELFSELKWMRFPDRVIYQKAVLTYKITNTTLPERNSSLHIRSPPKASQINYSKFALCAQTKCRTLPKFNCIFWI